MDTKTFQRKDFLNLAFGAAGALAITETLFVGLRFLTPRSSEGEFGGSFNLGSASDFPPGTVTPVEMGNFYVVRLPDSGFLAVYRRCTHLGCSVPYDPAVGQFVCPCHGSVFSQQGEVQNTPASRPLDLFAISFDEEGNLIVDTGDKIERDHVDSHQISYWQGV